MRSIRPFKFCTVETAGLTMTKYTRKDIPSSMPRLPSASSLRKMILSMKRRKNFFKPNFPKWQKKLSPTTIRFWVSLITPHYKKLKKLTET